MKVAILALQGAFAEHTQMLRRLGVDSFLVRGRRDWDRHKDALIIPGGESTAMMRIIRDESLLVPVRDSIMSGLPVFGTCAGLIMLDDSHLGTMAIEVRRNAYGRHSGSFCTIGEFAGVGTVPMTFIRAPYIAKVRDGAEALSVVDGHIVAARQGRQVVTAFHPELDDDVRIHEFFLSLIRGM